jgi:hypothetical protein
VNLVCPETGEPTKVSVKFLDDGSKVRVARVSGAVIPKPDPATLRKTERRKACVNDTSAADAVKATFNGLEDLIDVDDYEHLLYVGPGQKKLGGAKRGYARKGNVASPHFVGDPSQVRVVD